MLFFTKPPIDTRHIVSGRKAGDKDKPLVHSEKYLQAKEERLKTLAQRKRTSEEIIGHAISVEGEKRVKSGHFGEERDADGRIKVNLVAQADLDKQIREKRQRESEQALQLQLRAVKMLQDGMMRATVDEYRLKYGDKALEVFDADQVRSKAKSEDEQQRRLLLEDSAQQEDIEADTRKMLSQNFWTGRFPDGSGRFEDDFDNRLPR